MTSWRPYWCSKTKKRKPYLCSKPTLRALNSIFRQTFFCLSKPIWPLVTEAETLYRRKIRACRHSTALALPSHKTAPIVQATEFSDNYRNRASVKQMVACSRRSGNGEQRIEGMQKEKNREC